MTQFMGFLWIQFSIGMRFEICQRYKSTQARNQTFQESEVLNPTNFIEKYVSPLSFLLKIS